MDQITETVDIRPTELCDHCGVPYIACQCGASMPPDKKQSDANKHEQDEHWHPLEKHAYLAGRYKVLELIGKGGMGFVYKVRHEGLDRIFAVKVLNSGAIDRKLIKRFEAEAKAIGALHHENLVSVHDFGTTDDGIIYLVMEYLEGTTLDKELEKASHIPEGQAIDIFIQVCEGLSCAHSKGIVHRDLKPNNIMLVKGENDRTIAKIVDFGIAKRESVDTRLTQTGEVFGTPVYMSPEQCQAQLVDARSDLYSLGCVMYEALSGKPPFVCENAIQTLFKHVNDEPLPIRKACDGFTVSSTMEKLITRCLEKELKLRVQSADELALNLRRIKSGERLTQTNILPRVKKRHVLLASKWAIGAYIVAISACLIYTMQASLTPQPVWKKKVAEARTALQKNNFLQAAQLFHEALAAAEQSNESVKDKASVMRSLANAYNRANDTSKVIEWDRKIIALASANHLDAYEANAALSLVQVMDVTAGDEEELEQLKDAISSIERTRGKNSKSLIKPLVKYGALANRLEHFAESAAYLERALSIMESSSGKTSSNRGNSERTSAGTSESEPSSMDQSTAQSSLDRANSDRTNSDQSNGELASSVQASPPQTPAEVLSIYEYLVGDYTHVGNFERAEELYQKALSFADSNYVSPPRLHHLQRFGERLHAKQKKTK